MPETRINPWVGKIPLKRKWQPTPGFLPGKSHGQRSLAGMQRDGHGVTKQQQHLDSIWKRPARVCKPHFTEETARHLVQVIQQESVSLGQRFRCPASPSKATSSHTFHFRKGNLAQKHNLLLTSLDEMWTAAWFVINLWSWYYELHTMNVQ